MYEETMQDRSLPTTGFSLCVGEIVYSVYKKINFTKVLSQIKLEHFNNPFKHSADVRPYRNPSGWHSFAFVSQNRVN